MQPSDSVSDLSANLPAIGAMSIFTSAVFGNTGFMIAPSQTGQVSYDYGKIPYYSLEGQLMMEQLLAQTMPESVLPGQSQGQHNTSGQVTVTNPAGQLQVAIGTATTQSGSF